MVSTTERQFHEGPRPGRGEGRGRRASGGRRRRRPRPRATPGDVVRGIVRFFGEIMLTAGLLMLFYAGYEVYGSQWETDREQQDLAQGLEEAWSAEQAAAEAGPDSEPLPGSADSRLYVPSLDLDWVVVNGTTQEDIRYSPGHYTEYPSSPGGEGNYAVAAHRTPGLFWDLDLLRNGDVMVLEDGENFYTYEVFRDETVLPTDVWVIEPDPFDEATDEEPGRSLLTLTTCAPKLNNTHRLIVWAELVETTPKSEGMPDSIAHMAPQASE
ncbi:MULTISPECIES: class E sortase [Nocardiopsis]|uniref:Sortase family protein n=1 Tax=Nocardiopsis dassonvillei (strain ATCC 23218 / DSM 43111 / CIP 107115 / JCM 7437 / KCTC 9190 / NBRC 14626 / NCTC 10488 / NRRL B-5397 / IMRU 509) TaxID=446468 RepID=D7AVG1_NOCDD|nr:sortase family protein [Nocardiopsis dassonvillei subsp. dassonvillei DSM 43111]APC34159.1 class E sortase [Nocardiopsis dassonvillei]NKY78756.1 class E sortase [Nocardiopsis dassonvillei]VEI91843.1 Sortase (surface protein transpeptidase) [Nocardiopsis dassonvillei]